MTVYTIASGKGGVGKTVSTVNIGAALSALGQKTLVMDCDIGMANLNLMVILDTKKQFSLHDVLAGKADIHDAITHTSYGMDVLPSGISIKGFRQADPEKLRGVMGQIVYEYEFILIDAPAGISKESVIPLAVSDEVVLIVNPELPSITDALKTKLITDIVGRRVKGAIINRVMGMKSELSASRIAELLEVPIISVIPNDRSVMKSAALKVPVVVREPGSPAAKQFKVVARKLANIGPLDVVEKEASRSGFISRLLKSLGVKA